MVATAPPETAAVSRRFQPRLDLRAAWAWTLTLALVLDLGIDGGGYDLVVRSHAGVIIWWILIVGAVLGLAPASRLGRARQVALVLLGAFAAWSTASTLWSLSSERSLDEVSRLATYLGILWLAALSLGDRRVLAHVVGALATGIFVIAGLALLGRLHPGLFAGATATANALPGTRSRLSWPLNYWNALGALIAFGVPLFVALATSARHAWARSAAAAAVPAIVLCGYLTFSRTSAVAAALALVVFVALSPPPDLQARDDRDLRRRAGPSSWPRRSAATPSRTGCPRTPPRRRAVRCWCSWSSSASSRAPSSSA